MRKPEALSCSICHHTPWDGKGVEVSLIRWAEDGKFGAGPRCRDAEECHRRVTEAGETWPLLERVVR